MRRRQGHAPAAPRLAGRLARSRRRRTEARLRRANPSAWGLLDGSSHCLHEGCRPVVLGPTERRYPQRRPSIMGRIVSVIDDVILPCIAQNCNVAQSAPAWLARAGCEYESSAALHHRLAAAIHIGTENVFGAADDRVVAAICAAAAKNEKCEKIVIARALGDENG